MRFGTSDNAFDLSDTAPVDTTEAIVDVAVSVLQDITQPSDSRFERMARWIVRNLAVPDDPDMPGVMVDNYDDTVALGEDHLEWWPTDKARLLATMIFKAVDRVEK